MKRLCTGMLVAVMVMAQLAATALAVEPGEQRVTLGADLTEDQIEQIYADFGLERAP